MRIQGNKTKSMVMMAYAIITFLACFVVIQTPDKAQAQTTELPEQSGQIGLPLQMRGDPNAVIKGYYTFISGGQFSEALDLLGPSFGLDPVREVSQEMRNLNSRIREGEIAVSLDRVVKQGNWALAVLIIDAKSESGSQQIIADQYMLYLNERWTVVPKQLREDPQFNIFYDQDAINLYNWWQENRGVITAEILKN